MNNMEEILWNYIDGNCTPEEQKAVSKLIAMDEAYRLQYHELLKLNNEFAAMELDEPPMAFTYNVIEAIRTEEARKPLKAAINKRIILGITIFFVLTISILLVYTLTNIRLSGGHVEIPISLKMPNIGSYITKPLVQSFLFFDLVLGLYLADTYLRKKRLQRQA